MWPEVNKFEKWYFLNKPHTFCKTSLNLRVGIWEIGRGGHRKFELNSATANSAKLQEVFRNRKFASSPQVCDNFRTSSSANAHCTSVILDSNIYYYFVFSRWSFFLEIKFCRRPDVDLQKKQKQVMNTGILTSYLGNEVVHFPNGFYSRTCNTVYCFADLR